MTAEGRGSDCNTPCSPVKHVPILVQGMDEQIINSGNLHYPSLAAPGSQFADHIVSGEHKSIMGGWVQSGQPVPGAQSSRSGVRGRSPTNMKVFLFLQNKQISLDIYITLKLFRVA